LEQSAPLRRSPALFSLPTAFIRVPDGFMFWLGLSLGCMAILMMYHLVGGAWGTVIRRILESGMMTLPLMFVLFIPILLNLPKLYFWARPGLTIRKWLRLRTPISTSTASWCATFFTSRVDRDGILPESLVDRAGHDHGPEHAALRALSSIGLVIYSLTDFVRCDRLGDVAASALDLDIYGLLSLQDRRSLRSASAWSSRTFLASAGRCPAT